MIRKDPFITQSRQDREPDFVAIHENLRGGDRRGCTRAEVRGRSGVASLSQSRLRIASDWLVQNRVAAPGGAATKYAERAKRTERTKRTKRTKRTVYADWLVRF
jgi:hypothetical protein